MKHPDAMNAVARRQRENQSSTDTATDISGINTQQSGSTHDLNHLEAQNTTPSTTSKPSSDQVMIAPSWILHNFHEAQSYDLTSQNDLLTPSASPASPRIPRTIHSDNVSYICHVLRIPQQTVNML